MGVEGDCNDGTTGLVEGTTVSVNGPMEGGGPLRASLEE